MDLNIDFIPWIKHPILFTSHRFGSSPAVNYLIQPIKGVVSGWLGMLVLGRNKSLHAYTHWGPKRPDWGSRKMHGTRMDCNKVLKNVFLVSNIYVIWLHRISSYLLLNHWIKSSSSRCSSEESMQKGEGERQRLSPMISFQFQNGTIIQNFFFSRY